MDAKSAGEVQWLYVAENWHGKGVAQQLMNRCIEEIQRRKSECYVARRLGA